MDDVIKKEREGDYSSLSRGDLEREVDHLRFLQRYLCEIGKSISSEHNLDNLLNDIVEGCRWITYADAGSLYIIEPVPGADPDSPASSRLRFAVAQNHSKDIPFKSFTLPVTPENLSGYAALTKTPHNIPDAYNISDDAPYRINTSFDMTIGYKTKSMIVVPMLDQKEEVVGVVQLINKKRDLSTVLDCPETVNREVIEFTKADEEILMSLASQAGIAIERSRLYHDIERLLRGFVVASATAIEARDPTTSGHSKRIAAYMVVLAKRLSKIDSGPFKDLSFSPDDVRQIFYAAMLHDMGKIGVREHVLLKADKLSPEKMAEIRWRFACFKAVLSWRAAEGKISREDAEAEAARLDDDLLFLDKVNKPGFLPNDDLERLREIAERGYLDPEGSPTPLITAYELENLSVIKGNLTKEERQEMNNHVVHSIEILKKIPWTSDLARVPEIAGSHHEKLNGSGYPYGLDGDQIPIEGQMLAVVDIFEALTAMDRPYKPPIPVERSLAILRSMVEAGELNGDILGAFIDLDVASAVSDEERKRFDKTEEEILSME